MIWTRKMRKKKIDWIKISPIISNILHCNSSYPNLNGHYIGPREGQIFWILQIFPYFQSGSSWLHELGFDWPRWSYLSLCLPPVWSSIIAAFAHLVEFFDCFLAPLFSNEETLNNLTQKELFQHQFFLNFTKSSFASQFSLKGHSLLHRIKQTDFSQLCSGQNNLL